MVWLAAHEQLCHHLRRHHRAGVLRGGQGGDLDSEAKLSLLVRRLVDACICVEQHCPHRGAGLGNGYRRYLLPRGARAGARILYTLYPHILVGQSVCFLFPPMKA